MPHFIKNLQTVDGLISNLYKDISIAEMTEKINHYFDIQGYKVINQQFGNLILEKGNRTMRILFGAFVKYFKFSVTITQTAEDELTVNVFQQSSGISGGLIGMNQVKTELTRLNFVFSQI
ncbi:MULTISPECIES: hypothetical protein [unclassified Pedobacter]|uniref:hypothetical protein n=1 Tax=unclassified Pedobacter TaxID=2628915 RepID=UPI000B4ACB03|nr:MULTISPECIES: hypothetical protein [unclassified Pedobacter]MCX2583409.1 hypothetical protein [Pedobacter sp. MR22-3]OWK72101.1 hypothetical protein CBW18_00520 [Pedobacter sp. AJM]